MNQKKTYVMDEYGFSARDWSELKKVFLEYPEIQKVLLFGSRAMKKHKNGSDIDLAVISNTPKVVKRVHQQLEEETSIPYFVDVIDFKTLSSEPLIDHITRNGVLVYEA